VLIDLGKRDVSDQQCFDMLKEVDRNNDDVLQWDEFLELFRRLKVNNKDLFSQVL